MIDEPLRQALAELELASRWVLPDLGFDLPRLQDEADTFAQATPLSDRILASYKAHLTYWVEQRMALDGDAATQLARAERMLAERAEVVETEGFPRVANGLRAASGDPLWTALAERVAESVLQ